MTRWITDAFIVRKAPPFLAFAASVFLFFLIIPAFVHSQQSATPVIGWAWSDTVGWISLNGSDYGLTYNTDGEITGWAWNDNIGWIKFGGLSGFPTGSGTQSANAQFSDNKLVGWARACAATVGGDCSGGAHPEGGGWDGWIALNGSWSNGVYANNDGLLAGYAWGGDVVGWVQFSADMTPPCASTAGYFCTDSDTRSVLRSAWCQETPQAPNPCSTSCSPGTGQCVTGSPTAISGCLSTAASPVCQKSLRIRGGAQIKLYWDMQNAHSCTVQGTNGDGGVSAGAQWNTVSQTAGVTTSPIRNTTRYTISCDSGTFTDSVLVNILPEFKEI